MTDPFVYGVEVRIYEVDSAGVVFNAWYLAWCDDARLAYLASRGYPLERAMAADALPLVRHADIEWLTSLQAGDHAEIVVRPVRVGETSFTLRHEIHRAGDGMLSAVATITYVAAVSWSGSSGRFPLACARLWRRIDWIRSGAARRASVRALGGPGPRRCG